MRRGGGAGRWNAKPPLVASTPSGRTFAGLALGVVRGTRGPSPLGSILAQVRNAKWQ